jgi:NADH-quinone oxidoreductase subunit M
MGGFPILSALTFLPLVGALIIMAVRAATAGSSSSESANEGRTALLAGLVISGATFLVSLAAFFYYDPSTPGYQLVEQHVWYQSISYKHGCGRHFDAVRHPDHLPDAAVHPGQLEFDPDPRDGNT